MSSTTSNRAITLVGANEILGGVGASALKNEEVGCYEVHYGPETFQAPTLKQVLQKFINAKIAVAPSGDGEG